MPVPTDTFWNIRKLNIIFAATGLLLLASMLLLLNEDHDRPWRGFQQEGTAWEAAMTRDAQQNALTANQRHELQQLQDELVQRDRELKNDQTLKDLRAKLETLQKDKATRDLPLRKVKGELTPLNQRIEKAMLETGADSPVVRNLKAEFASKQSDYEQRYAVMAQLDLEIAAVTKAIDREVAKKSALEKQIDDLTRKQRGAQEKLAKLDPQGLAMLGEKIRNAPLSDWFNPSEKVQQVVVPDVRTDLNFLTVETIDRCQTCHVNIDNPRYEEPTLLRFVERQVAVEKQDLNALPDGIEPVVMLEFWIAAAKARAAVVEGQTFADGLKAAGDAALAKVNELRAAAGLKPIESADKIVPELERITLKQGDSKDAQGNVVVTRGQWYEPAYFYLSDLRRLLEKNSSQEEFRSLRSLYRHALIGQYNADRIKHGQPALSASAVMLAHPDLHLYVDAESKHPMKTMGCTVCHEGSGQESQFEHTAHTPRQIWVDAQSGAEVPDFLLAPSHEGKSGHAPEKMIAGVNLDGAQVALASAEAPAEHAASAPGGAVYSHFDVKITSPGQPAPFAPETGEHAQEAEYHDLLHHGQTRQAVRQEEFWTRKYGWEEVHYMHWERPMHRLDYVESSCARCHSQYYDIKDAAPRLFEGRRLFAQLGCVNCHQVDQIKDAMDIKKVGPSLAYVKEKLSPEMMGSWIWSPKAFRPMTRMPHFFMLENNSSPIDILRTRTEVAAMTYYLQHAQPAANVAKYEPEPAPKKTGDAKRGQQIFNTVGCLACHTNMAEVGQKWIVDDLIQRTGASRDEAKKQFEAMSYNQQHWYALEHLQEKLVLVGPELSAVGTKLKTGRTAAQARAWVYDWVRNPRHYSSYTIMPSFRLSESEANDLAAYLLTLERPDYKPEDFLQLDDKGKAMLAELVANFKAAQVPVEYARQVVDGKKPDPETGKQEAWSQDQQLEFLGKKVISHYGCNGCHQINGFENAASACAQLDEWGLKDPHKLDFGYFDHAFDQDRGKPITVWKVAHEGLESDAPQITADQAQHAEAKVHPVSIRWEEMELERRPWLYNKLHNTRVYDRGRTTFEGKSEPGAGGEPIIGKPYDKLKMPKFFLTDTQVRSIVTFVTSLRRSQVSDSLRARTYNEASLRVAHGRQLATLYNCYGCHNIEGNDVHLQEFLPVHREDGSKDLGKLNDFAPPRLIAEGARTQPEWLHGFLLNVRPIRPWLMVRMPSFPLSDTAGDTSNTNDNATHLVDYFAGATQEMATKVDPIVKPIALLLNLKTADQRVTVEMVQKAAQAYAAANNGKEWFESQRIAEQLEKLKAYGISTDIAKASDLDPRQASVEDRRDKWNRLLVDAIFLSDLYRIKYPFPAPPAPATSADSFARGEALFKELKCTQCHTLGDERILAQLKKLDAPGIPGAPAATAKPAEEEDPYGEAKPAAKDAAAAKGDDDGYGEEAPSNNAAAEGPELSLPMLANPVTLGGPGFAPNLSEVTRRLQYRWVERWLQETTTIHPGTRMPPQFPNGDSVFAKYPEEAKAKLESLYGYSGPQQRSYLLDFLYTAGLRNYTPGAEHLNGAAAAPTELPALTPPPKPAEPAAPAAPGKTEPASEAKPAPAPAVAKPAAVEAKPEPVTSSIQLQEAPSAAFEGTRIVGVARFEGKAPARRVINMQQDPACVSAHKTPALLPSPMIVNADQTMQNVLVYVKAGLPAGQKFPLPPDAEIEQRGCEYHPHVLAVMTGQGIKIRNGDATQHNVNIQPRLNAAANFGQGPGVVDKLKFSKPEMAIPLKCDIHPWMNAFVHALPHPFFAVTDVQGRFEIKGLPAGKYTLEAVQEDKRVAPVSFEVTVEEKTSHRADVTLK